MVMMWYGEFRGKPKYRCPICVADAKIKVDQACKAYRNVRHGRKDGVFDGLK